MKRLRIADIAARLNVTTAAIYLWIGEGVLKAKKDGRRVIITEANLRGKTFLRFLENREAEMRKRMPVREECCQFFQRGLDGVSRCAKRTEK